MKKHIKLFIVLGIILVGSFSFYLFKGYKKDALVYENNKIMPSSSGIAMMLETSAGSGNYEMTTRSEWPTEGYVFNVNLSKCENGSELSWDNENKKVLMSGNKSDKCYVYFDVYVKPTIANTCSSGKNLATCIKTFGDKGSSVSNIYYHDASLTNGAGDNSYRYAGASDQVNNYEWTISRNAVSAYFVFYVIYTGYVIYFNANSALGVRPVFYLSSSVNYASGSGTAADPILVN